MSRFGGDRIGGATTSGAGAQIAGIRPEVTMPSQTHSWLMRDTRRSWPLMTTYERFEHIVAFMLSLIIAMLIALALVQLFVRVVPLLVTGALAHWLCGSPPMQTNSQRVGGSSRCAGRGSATSCSSANRHERPC